MRIFVALSFLIACSSDPGPIGSSATALVVGDQVRVYLGQPGVSKDVPRIEAGEHLDYHWWRLGIPAAELELDEPATFNLSDEIDRLQYWEYFTIAPGCPVYPTPWIGRWDAGDPGVSGSVTVTQTDGDYRVSFEFDFEGTFETPCGPQTGRHGSSNAFAGTVE